MFFFLVLLLQTVIQFIKRILGIFGIDFDQQTNTGASGAVNKEEVLYPYVNELVQFRKSVRAAVFEGKKVCTHSSQQSPPSTQKTGQEGGPVSCLTTALSC